MSGSRSREEVVASYKARLRRWSENVRADIRTKDGCGEAVVQWYTEDVERNYKNETAFLLYIVREALNDADN